MRVTEHRMMQVFTGTLSRARTDIARAGEELSSGARVRRPSDDLAAWTDGTRARIREQLSEAHRGAFNRARDQLVETERQLETMGAQVETALARAVEFANGTYNAIDRQRGAQDIRSLRDRFLDTLNGQGYDGEFLFGGSDRTQAPFDTSGVYVSDAVERSVAVDGPSRQLVTISGGRFTATSGLDIYAALDRFAAALDANDQTAVNTAVQDMQLAVDQVAGVRTDVGIRMNALDDARDARESLELHLAEVQADRLGTDAVQSALDFARGQTALEGARTAIERLMVLFQAR